MILFKVRKSIEGPGQGHALGPGLSPLTSWQEGSHAPSVLGQLCPGSLPPITSGHPWNVPTLCGGEEVVLP